MIKHARTRAYTRVHARTRAYTRVHARTRGYTRVHARTRGHTRVRVLTLNSMYLAHKWTQKWRIRGFGRVDDRTRGFTRVRAGARAYVSLYLFRVIKCTEGQRKSIWWIQYAENGVRLRCLPPKPANVQGQDRDRDVRVRENVRTASFSAQARHEPKSV